MKVTEKVGLDQQFNQECCFQVFGVVRPDPENMKKGPKELPSAFFKLGSPDPALFEPGFIVDQGIQELRSNIMKHQANSG